MMTSVFRRGRKLYAKIRNVDGKWTQVATGFDVGQEQQAKRWAADADRQATQLRETGPLTVARYAERWIVARKTASIKDDATRLRLHALPVIGSLPMTEVRPRHLRDLVMQLRNAGHLAPTTIRQVSGLLHTLFKSALIEELVMFNPVVFERGVLPKKVDKDPTWRHEAIYTRGEVERLISDDRLLADRRVLYALKLLAALRHKEAAELTWAQWDPTLRPLGAINLGQTKSKVPRRVPVHPTLASILAAWKICGWFDTYGRQPRPDDLVVPTRRMRARAPAESQKQLLADLETIELRTSAGEKRNRRGHDLRRTMITLARADGAIDGMLRWVTHGPKPADMLDVYSSPPWEVLCAEVAKLRVRFIEGAVVQLGAAVVQSAEGTDDKDENERPQRDSKAFLTASGDT